jgi:hypothetical protein
MEGEAVTVSQSSEQGFIAASDKVDAAVESLREMHRNLQQHLADVHHHSSGEWTGGLDQSIQRMGTGVTKLLTQLEIINSNLDANLKVHRETVALTQQHTTGLNNILNL